MVYHCEIRIEKNDSGEDIFIAQFPDMTNIVTCGFSKDEALAMAKEALDGCLESSIENGMEIVPSSFKGGYPITVANNIVVSLQLRKLRGKESQSEIAKRLNISYQAYQRLENPRKANPTIKTLERIARAYGRDLNISM
jgi:antitoxin HicB